MRRRRRRRKQREAAAKHFETYGDRAKAVRLETLERAAEELMVQGEKVKHQLEEALLADMAKSSVDSLKQRVIQLTVEARERTKWEALRLHETVKKAQDEVTAKYTGLVEKLRHESVEELERQARAFEADKELALRRLSEEKDEAHRRAHLQELEAHAKQLQEGFEERIKGELAQAEARAKVAVQNAVYQEHEKIKADVSQRLDALADLSAKVEALNRVFADSSDYEHVSWGVHKLTAAVMALELKLGTPEPVYKELAALKKITAGDAVVEAVLTKLPEDVGRGVPTLPELQVRFARVRGAAREAAFVPESQPGLVGHIVGSTFAALSIQPKGLVPGSGTDEVLARAAYHVELGHLGEAVTELKTLQGLPAKTVQDWVRDAKARLQVEQAMKVLNARCALQNASLI